MKDSALVAPYITSDELERFSSQHLLQEEHSSKDWISILDDLHATHGSREQLGVDSITKKSPSSDQAFNFDAAVGEGEEFQEALASPTPAAPRPTEVYSMARGVGALRMLSSSGMEALKLLLPVSNLFGTLEEQKGSGEADVGHLKAMVETLLKVVPAGLEEGEERLKEVVRLLEEDGDRRSKAFQALLFDLFGGRD